MDAEQSPHLGEPEPLTTRRLTLIGFVLCGAVGVIGWVLDQIGQGQPGTFSVIRLLLIAVGLLTLSSVAVSSAMRWQFWLLAAAATLAAHFGVPQHWDSGRMLVRVLVGLCLTASVLVALSYPVRVGIISVATLFHFSGIFLATTWPEPTPWFTYQIGTRVHLPYIQFMYLRNAYHFYSPEPGPASHLFCLVTYEEIDPATGQPFADWITHPNRKHDWKDPLGLAYYRRLSLTEQVSNATPLLSQTEERKEIDARRAQVSQGLHSKIPQIPNDPNESLAYRMPRPDTTRYLLPSYAAHLLNRYTTANRKAKTVKLYRVEHSQVSAAVFVTSPQYSPHHPTGFKPFYLGEFQLTADGSADLVDQQDPMLYWHVPILPRSVPRGSSPGIKDYDDYLSKHAKYEFNWEARTP